MTLLERLGELVLAPLEAANEHEIAVFADDARTVRRRRFAARYLGLDPDLVGPRPARRRWCPCLDHEPARAVTRGTHAAHATVTPLGERAGRRIGRGLTRS